MKRIKCKYCNRHYGQRNYDLYHGDNCFKKPVHLQQGYWNSILALTVAVLVAIVAAWYSIVGLMAIFSAAAVEVAIMASTLEVAKLVSASWLYRNWHHATKLLKIYLTTAVIILMFITSLGIFGFLSKAHMDQTLVSGDNNLLIEMVDTKIERQQKRVDDAELVLSQLDKSVQVLIDNDRIRGDSGAIAVRESQKEERDQLTSIVDEAMDSMAELNREKLELSKEQLALEVEVGPIKYIAAVIYDDVDNTILEKAVRFIIILIIFVFDPLAVILLIAGNYSLDSQRKRNLSQSPMDMSQVSIIT